MAFWKMGIDCDGLLARKLTKLEFKRSNSARHRKND